MESVSSWGDSISYCEQFQLQSLHHVVQHKGSLRFPNLMQKHLETQPGKS